MLKARIVNVLLSASLCLLSTPILNAEAGDAKAKGTANAAGTKSADVSVTITSASDTVKAGDKATVEATSVPGASCDIAVKLKSGKSKNSELTTKTADSSGKVSWQWTIAKNTSAGDAEITVTATSKRKKATATKTIKITK